MKWTKFVFLAFIAVALAQPVFAADNPWLGTWKLNPAKSTLTGDTNTVAKIPNGYHFDYGAVKYDVFEDGRDHPVEGDYTVNLKPVGKGSWLLIRKLHGTEVYHATIQLSPDEKRVTEDVAGVHADGSSFKERVSLERVGSGMGLTGTWRDVKATSVDRTVKIYSDAGNGKLKKETPSSQEVVVVSLDGTPAKPSGPRVVNGETLAETKISETELKYTISMAGHPYIEGKETVTLDGKVLKDVNWLVIKPSEPATEIWEKQ